MSHVKKIHQPEMEIRLIQKTRPRMNYEWIGIESKSIAKWLNAFGSYQFTPISKNHKICVRQKFRSTKICIKEGELDEKNYGIFFESSKSNLCKFQ